ncbi:MAG TPA: hypothetical protein VGV93_02985 [Acidimicrobiales bacterium]|nr:hypothetical protein [Acidimicrobiales bacterium]
MSLQYKIGLVLCALLGVFDVLSVAGAGAEDAPPTPVVVLGLILGLITLVGVFLAWRGAKKGFIAVVVSRVLSALSAVPAFFVEDVPGWVPVAVGIGIVVTVIALGLLFSERRQAAPGPLAQL